MLGREVLGQMQLRKLFDFYGSYFTRQAAWVWSTWLLSVRLWTLSNCWYMMMPRPVKLLYTLPCQMRKLANSWTSVPIISAPASVILSVLSCALAFTLPKSQQALTLGWGTASVTQWLTVGAGQLGRLVGMGRPLCRPWRPRSVPGRRASGSCACPEQLAEVDHSTRPTPG